jgi:hypothetical protein
MMLVLSRRRGQSVIIPLTSSRHQALSGGEIGPVHIPPERRVAGRAHGSGVAGEWGLRGRLRWEFVRPYPTRYRG